MLTFDDKGEWGGQKNPQNLLRDHSTTTWTAFIT